MAGLYTHLWTRKYGDTPSREWMLCLDGLTPELVADGFRRVVRDKRFQTYPPNPIEFRAACYPSYEELGLPPIDVAFREATNNAGRSPEWRKWTHPAIYQAACEAGFSNLKTSEEREAKTMFNTAYESVVKRVMAGEVLQIPERLEKKPDQPCTKEQAKKHVADLKATLGF